MEMFPAGRPNIRRTRLEAAKKTKLQQESERHQPMSERTQGVPKHEFYMVVFEQLGVGTPHYLPNVLELHRLIIECIDKQLPFHVGHEFRGTLTDGNNQAL